MQGWSELLRQPVGASAIGFEHTGSATGTDTVGSTVGAKAPIAIARTREEEEGSKDKDASNSNTNSKSKYKYKYKSQYELPLVDPRLAPYLLQLRAIGVRSLDAR